MHVCIKKEKERTKERQDSTGEEKRGGERRGEDKTHRLRILKSGYSLHVVDVVGVAVIAIIGVVSVFVYFCAVAISCSHVFNINALPNVLACRINRVCPWNGPGQPGPVA